MACGIRIQNNSGSDMKRELKAFAAVTLGLALAPAALATNGDIMEGIGPISTALGGTGVN